MMQNGIPADRVAEITTDGGTGALTLTGAVLSYQTFSQRFSDGDELYYGVVDTLSGEWETGKGTYLATGPALQRDAVRDSSNSGAPVNFSNGQDKLVYVTRPAYGGAFFGIPPVSGVYEDGSAIMAHEDGDTTVALNTRGLSPQEDGGVRIDLTNGTAAMNGLSIIHRTGSLDKQGYAIRVFSESDNLRTFSVDNFGRTLIRNLHSGATQDPQQATLQVAGVDTSDNIFTCTRDGDTLNVFTVKREFTMFGYNNQAEIIMRREAGLNYFSIPDGAQLTVRGYPSNTRYATVGSTSGWTANSDRSMKDEIAPLTRGLEAVRQMQPVMFRWKADGRKAIGFIAQDMEPIVPEAVEHTAASDGEPEWWGLRKDDLVPVLVNAIRELDDRLKAIEAG